MDRRTSQDIEKFIKGIQKSVTQEEYKDLLEKATQPTIDSIKMRTPVGNKPVKRYVSKSSSKLSKRGQKQDKPIAIYYPGNLRRSIQLLDHLNKANKKRTWNLRRVYFGVKLHKGKSDGIFRGDRVDAYYAHMIENGTSNGIAGVGYFRKGVNAGAQKSLNRLKQLVQRRLKGNLRRNGFN